MRARPMVHAVRERTPTVIKDTICDRTRETHSRFYWYVIYATAEKQTRYENHRPLRFCLFTAFLNVSPAADLFAQGPASFEMQM